jgi:endogenous inhibitor of DNA gyrase (YacG/DUF329 family)
MYMGCPKCGYSEDWTHGSKFCPECGTELEGPVSDTREICSEEQRNAYKDLKKAEERFHEVSRKRSSD